MTVTEQAKCWEGCLSAVFQATSEKRSASRGGTNGFVDAQPESGTGSRSKSDAISGHNLLSALATARKTMGWSQRTMAERIGVDPQTIKRLEAGVGSASTLTAVMTSRLPPDRAGSRHDAKRTAMAAPDQAVVVRV